ncbi:phosphatase PAP2 family protein [Kribbella solani]|uniref:phosphatase PAP2 family protein n=1 Tax=Kribbella solani TaxID=236067 RepID=UPI0016115DE1|nr:phosphatase PAP2 family protein [Kribbella solani]
MQRSGVTWVQLLAVASSVAFLVLAVIASAGQVDALDQDLRQVFRPDDVWGPWQLVFGNVVDGAAPRVSLAVLAVSGALAAVLRTSWRPLVYVAALALTGALVTQVAKALIGRADPHGDVGTLSGSFPSGHMVILLVCLGGVLLVWRQHPPVWAWALVALAGLTMGFSLLLLSMHWFTDVAGGALLAVPLLVVAASPRFVGPVHRTGRTTPASVGSPT